MNDDKLQPRESSDYFINTAPEMDALERAAADGKHGRNYQNNQQGQARFHSIPGASHSVLLELTATEGMAGLTTETLETLTREQDADAALAFLYIARILAPPIFSAVQSGRGTVDFDDVLSKIGWDPRSSEERREMHKRIYQFILFGERAQVIGERRGKYKDKHTGQVINTVIRSALWRVLKTETPEQQNLFPSQEVPVRVGLVMSDEWIKILTSPQTAQYLPMGELLGAIPGNKPSGAWARVIGLSLASFWRRLPREALDGSIRPTRRELLERYPPKTGTVEELLNSDKPHRAIDYWCSGLEILRDQGFIEHIGEATLLASDFKKRYPRKGWGEQWLNETADLRPGDAIRPAIYSRQIALPAPSSPKKRGRPKKTI
jgi:hypothetical protein